MAPPSALPSFILPCPSVALQDRESSREQLIFLIDASEPMLAPCDVRKKRLRRQKPGGEGGDPAGPAVMQQGDAEEQEEDVRHSWGPGVGDGWGSATRLAALTGWGHAKNLPVSLVPRPLPVAWWPAPAGSRTAAACTCGPQARHWQLHPPAQEVDDEFEGKSWLEAAVHVMAAVMRQKVIAASGDRMAVMFYNTVSRRHSSQLCGASLSGQRHGTHEQHACACAAGQPPCWHRPRASLGSAARDSAARRCGPPARPGPAARVAQRRRRVQRLLPAFLAAAKAGAALRQRHLGPGGV